jgi:hypothetical protein
MALSLKWVLVIAGGVLLVPRPTAEQNVTNSGPRLAVTNRAPAAVKPPSLNPQTGGRIILSTNANGTIRAYTIPAPATGNLPLTNQATLAPGIYKTEPYACIVIVPGPHPDDRSLIQPPSTPSDPMPVIKPDLRFVPVRPK